jgi:hypothetical protein
LEAAAVGIDGLLTNSADCVAVAARRKLEGWAIGETKLLIRKRTSKVQLIICKVRLSARRSYVE